MNFAWQVCWPDWQHQDGIKSKNTEKQRTHAMSLGNPKVLFIIFWHDMVISSPSSDHVFLFFLPCLSFLSCLSFRTFIGQALRFYFWIGRLDPRTESFLINDPTQCSRVFLRRYHQRLRTTMKYSIAFAVVATCNSYGGGVKGVSKKSALYWSWRHMKLI